jgi:hypothetical protein
MIEIDLSNFVRALTWTLANRFGLCSSSVLIPVLLIGRRVMSQYGDKPSTDLENKKLLGGNWQSVII